MRRLYFFLIIQLFFVRLQAQSLEQQFTKASSKQEQMQIAMQIAQQNKTTDPRKAATYAQKAYDLATLLSNGQVQAQSSWIGAEAFNAQKNVSQAKLKLERCATHAENNGDFALASECYKMLIGNAQRDNNFKDASRYGLLAADLLRKKGGGSSKNITPPAPSTSTADNSRWQTLSKENERLQQENSQLRSELRNNSSLEQKLGGEKAKFADVQRQIEKQKQETNNQLDAFEKEISTLGESEQKTKKTLKMKELALEKAKAQQEKLVAEQEKLVVEQEKELNKTRSIFGGAALCVLALSGILYTRYRQKKKSAQALEDKNKLIEEERKRSDELLLNILPAPIADELKRDGKAQARQYKDVTVLFTDFKNFTTISERLTPEQLVQELDYCFKAFDFIIGQYNIEKIKTIGDAYMCASGLTQSGGSATKMVRAGMEMQEFLEDYKNDRISRGLPYFEARIGIHTGPVVAGVVGSKKFAYDIWGDTVNIAARMEQACEAGRVNISESTYWIVKYDYDCLYRGKLPAKNKGEIDMYFVKGKI